MTDRKDNSAAARAAEERRPIKTLAELNARNRDAHPPVPLLRRDPEGRIVDDRFRRK